MKKMKKFASVLLALVMALALAVPALAAPANQSPDATYSITINNNASGYEYAAYQIFSGELSYEGDTKILSNIVWGSGVNEDVRENSTFAFKYTYTVEEEGEEVEKTFSSSDAAEIAAFLTEQGEKAAIEFANQITATIKIDGKEEPKYLSTEEAKSTFNDAEKTYTIKGLEPGYYLVLNTDVPVTDDEEEIVGGAYTRYMLQIVGDATVNQKGTVPSSEKKIVEDGKGYDANEASIGDTVNYEITGTLPNNIGDYATYYYVFTDTLSKGLTANTVDNKLDVKVEIVNDKERTDVTDYFYIQDTFNDDDNSTTITVGIQDLLAFTVDDHKDDTIFPVTINQKTTIVITYSATLNENAVIAGTGNPNDVVLEYSNDPNHSGTPSTTPPGTPEEPEPEHPTGVTPKDEVITYTTELNITKVDGNGNILPGAEFTLTGESVNTVLVYKEEFIEIENDEDYNGDVYYLLTNGTYTTTAPTRTNTDSETGDVIVAGNESDYKSIDITYKLVKAATYETNENEEDFTAIGEATNGTVTFTGLGAGIYTLTESKTPAGYNTIDPIKFEVTFNKESGEFSVYERYMENGEEKTSTEPFTGQFTFTTIDGVDQLTGNVLDTTIVNVSGATLPETGGIGTTIFYVGGGILVAAAAILLITKKRMGSSDAE